MPATVNGRFARPFAIGGTITVVALIAGAALWWDSATSVAGAPMIANRPATPVSVATATQRDVPVFLTGLGTVQATNTISFTPR